jgi:TonB family protein
MLKPGSTRSSSVTPTRVSGPEWIESESIDPGIRDAGVNDPGVESNHILPFRDREDLPADLALDLRLREILQQARLATAASGAVIALARGDKMLCRATLGEKAPSTGVRLNTRSGLSGACVQTREMQLCDDALADPRVNVVACRDLGIRSIVVVPVLDGGELWGVLELFSSVPRAFSDSDLQVLQSLSRKISHTVHEAIEGGAAVRAPEPFSQLPTSEAESAEPMPTENPPDPAPQDTAVVRKDYRTGALTAAVLALAVLLGWMVGRVGWSLAVNRAPTQIPMSPEEAQARAPATPNVQPTPPHVEETAVPPKPVVAKPAAPVAKPRTETAAPVGGLVIYEHGKVVFRMAPSETPPVESNTVASTGVPSSVVAPSAIQKAATREEDSSGTPAPVSPAPANSYLLERVEPEYPAAAREQRIQGPVVLDALVGTSGSVRQLSVISGDPQLVKAATDAVRHWRFRPHELDGKAVEFETRITVNFALPE